MKNIALSLYLALMVLSTNILAGELESVFNEMADKALISNGDANVDTYNTKTFNWYRTKKSLEEDARPDEEDEDPCLYTVEGSRGYALDLIKDVEDDSFVAEKLEELLDQKKIKAAFTVEWDGTSGDSHYCMINTIYIYGKDGDLLYLDYNHTT